MGCDVTRFEASFKTVSYREPGRPGEHRGGRIPVQCQERLPGRKTAKRPGFFRDVSLSGRILETLMHVKAVGNDLKFNSGRCGKAGQLVPMSDGSPHLLVEQVTVGGAR
jgi:hypothetical protein